MSASSRLLPPTGRAFDEFTIGEEFETRSMVMTKDAILQFGNLTLDNHPLHSDEDYCRETPFGGIIAHGLLGLSLLAGLKSELGLYRGTSIASVGWDNVRFRNPIRIGEEIRVRVRIAGKTESSKGDRGILRQATVLLNASDSPLVEAEHLMLVYKRSALPPR